MAQPVESNYDNKYSVIQKATLSVTEVAKRPKYQLIASILYQLKFYLRRIGSQKELFTDEKEYTDVLDAIVQGIEENYPEINHVLDIIKLKRGNESKFDKVLRIKIELQKYMREQKLADIERRKRKKRNDTTQRDTYLNMAGEDDDPKDWEEKYFQDLIKDNVYKKKEKN